MAFVQTLALALPSAPTALTREPSALSGEVNLSWSPVTGATSYNIKRGTSATSTLVILGTVTSTTYTDNTATPGTSYYYTITANAPSGESPPTRGLMAATSIIVDNGSAETTHSGTWQTSTVSGFYGTSAVYAGPVTGLTPTATYTFTPNIPVRGNYDVYMRWTAHSNRASNTPVDLFFSDGSKAFTVNQQSNNGVWMLLSNITTEAGSSALVTIRNNGANGNVVADAVQFIPRLSPWAPNADKLSEYTLLSVDEPFDGTALDTAKWSTFNGRGEHSVSGGYLHTMLRYNGTVPLETATTADLENEANWAEGGIVAKSATKYGYHEARIRLPQLPARGVDIAYWHGATDELLNGYEIDAPEFFNKDSSGSSNNYGFGVWDHIDGQRTWDYHANYSTLGSVSQFVTIGLEWRTDNTQVVYVNGVKVYTAPPSGMNDTESILPSNIILSTKALDWMHPNVALSGSEATWDYARFYQKPGFLGFVDGDWSKLENWGPDGIPDAGYSAVFNMPSTPNSITLSSDQQLQSILLDGPSLPSITFSGTGALRLGAGKSGDASATHGGILINTNVVNHQTINNPIIGVHNLQFANLSRTSGNTLFLNGLISGDGISPRDVDFVTSIAGNTNLGSIQLAQPLGSGIRHINKAGDAVFNLPSNSQHSGELRIARGPVAISSLTALGTTADSAVVFRPRYKHSETWRPRLIYNGAGESSSHIIKLGGWQADGILESNGSGPLIWLGNLSIGPGSSLTNSDISLTLSSTASSGENVFSGNLSDDGVFLPDATPTVLRINKAGPGIWTLTGNNTFHGTTTINGGTLVVSSINSINAGVPSLTSSSLGTPKTIEQGTIAITSGTLKYTGNGETTDRVIYLAGSSGATIDHSGSGLLKFTSDFLSHTSSKILTLTGSGSGEISGIIPNNSISYKTSVTKSGSGTWTLSGNNTYTGTTTISNGSLAVNGNIAKGGTLTVSNSPGKLLGFGSIHTPSIVNGTLVTSPLTFTDTLTMGSSGKLLVNITDNSSTYISSITATAVTISNGAKVDITLNAPGSTTNFLQSWWRNTRTIPILNATSKSGTFAIGTVTTDSAGNVASTYGSFTLQQSPTSVNLVWTPIPGFPVIDVPTLAITTPTTDPVSIKDLQTILRANVAVTGNATITWSQLSGPGTATFSNPNSTDTGITFSAAGIYQIQVNATNALGSLTTHFTVNAAPPTSMSFCQGENSYNQSTTFIRGDSPTWNSGSRDQFLVGRTNNPFRGLLSFDLSTVPALATITSANLELHSAGLGVGTMLNTLNLHQMLVPFAEGTGDGNSAPNGSGTGADWTNRSGNNPWITPGAFDAADCNATPIASLNGYNPSTFTSGTAITLTSTSSFVAAANDAVIHSNLLSLMLKMTSDTSGNSLYTRIASDDHANVGYRPRLTLSLDYDFAPIINPGQIPSPAFGTSATLQGEVTNATSSTWTQLTGPAVVSFSNPYSPTTTALFPQRGIYQLSLAAINDNGETRKTLTITVISQIEAWRLTHFGTTANVGNSADYADPDHDGISNLIEFATGSLPNTPNGSTTTLIHNSSNLEFSYRRSHAAELDGVQFTTEWNDLLIGTWNIAGVSQFLIPATDNGESSLWRATLPLGTSRRFVHLKVTYP